jgi:predicted alpha/beta hydrolase family esterase
MTACVAAVDDVDGLLACGAYALGVRGDLHESRRCFDEAFALAEGVGDAEALAAAAIGSGGLWVHERRTAAGVAQLHARLRQALAGVEAGSGLGLRLRARLAGEADYSNGTHTEVLALLDEARRSGDAVAVAETLNIAHHCVLGPGHGPLRRRLAAELTELSVRTGRRVDYLLGLVWQAVDLFLDGDPHARRRLNELKAELAEEDHLAIGFIVDTMDVMLHIRAGRLDEAEALSQACAKRGAAAGDIDAEGWQVGQLVAIRWFQGRIGELVPLLDDLVHAPSLSAVDNSLFAALSVAAAHAGDKRTAAAALAVLSGRDLGRLPRSSSWLVMMHGLVEAAYLLEDATVAARAYELLAPYAELPMVASLGVACFGSTHHALGTAAATLGNLDAAIAHLHEAVRANLALNHWPALNASRLRHAELLERRGRPDDPGTAPTQPKAASCTREGQGWRIGWNDRTITVAHSVGMLHLAVLLSNPGQDVRSIDLVAGHDLIRANYDSAGPDQPMLDRTAINRYRDRLAQLTTQIEEHQAAGNREAADRARLEHDWLVGELSTATGIGGHTRSFPDSTERARTAVGKAIRRVLTRVTETDPDIGEHLRQSIRTGVVCSYRPT